MNNTYYDIIVLSLSAIVAGVYIYAASKEVNKSMRDLNAHNKAKKLNPKAKLKGQEADDYEIAVHSFNE